MHKIFQGAKLIAASMIVLLPGCLPPGQSLQCGGVSIPHSFIIQVLNKEISGFKTDLPLGRTLEVHNVNSLTSSDCRIWANADVTLHRPVLSAKKGTVTLRGDARLINLSDVCLHTPQVTKLDLEGIGDNILKLVANEFIPNKYGPDGLCLSNYKL